MTYLFDTLVSVLRTESIIMFTDGCWKPIRASLAVDPSSMELYSIEHYARSGIRLNQRARIQSHKAFPGACSLILLPVVWLPELPVNPLDDHLELALESCSEWWSPRYSCSCLLHCEVHSSTFLLTIGAFHFEINAMRYIFPTETIITCEFSVKILTLTISNTKIYHIKLQFDILLSQLLITQVIDSNIKAKSLVN